MCGYRVLSLPDPTMHDDDDCNITVLSGDLTRRMKHLCKTLNDFWKRWKTECLLELLANHFLRNPKGVNDHIVIVHVHDKNMPRELWKLERVQKLLTGAHGCSCQGYIKGTIN